MLMSKDSGSGTNARLGRSFRQAFRGVGNGD